MKLFHRHSWLVYVGNGFGNATHLRICQDESCGQHETRMFDIHTGKWSWIPGNFFEDVHSPIYIVAETVECYKDALRNIQTQSEKSIPVVWVKDDRDLDLMRRHPRPRFYLAADWKDTSISDRQEFAVLMMTRHIP